MRSSFKARRPALAAALGHPRHRAGRRGEQPGASPVFLPQCIPRPRCGRGAHRRGQVRASCPIFRWLPSSFADGLYPRVRCRLRRQDPAPLPRTVFERPRSTYGWSAGVVRSSDARKDENNDHRTFPRGSRASPQSAGSGATRPAAAVRTRSRRTRAPAGRGAVPGAGSRFPPGLRAARLTGECRSRGPSFRLLVSATPHRLRPQSDRRKVDTSAPDSEGRNRHG